MNILYLAHRIPYPPDKGEKLRACKQLEHLARNHRVSCACFVDRTEDVRHVAVLESMCARVAAIPLNPTRATVRGLLGWAVGSTVTESYYRVSAMRAVLDEWSRDTEFDAVVAFSSSMAGYALAVPARRRVLDLCDLDSRKWLDYAERSRPGMRGFYHCEGARLARRERAWIEAFDATVLITEAEAGALGPARFGKAVHIVGNGVSPPESARSCQLSAVSHQPDARTLQEPPLVREPLQPLVREPLQPLVREPLQPLVRESLLAPIFPGDPVACAPGSDRPTVGFIGTMDYRPNVDAVCWFVEKCWSDIRAAHPAAVFRIVGRSPTRAVRKLATIPGVEVTGTVPDAVDEVRTFQVSVAPLRIARGLQNKVLEAMALARPVVLTTGAARGIAGRHDHEFLIADTAQDTIDHVVRLLNDPAECRRVGLAARRFVSRHHRWEDQLSDFERIVTGQSGTGNIGSGRAVTGSRSRGLPDPSPKRQRGVGPRHPADPVVCAPDSVQESARDSDPAPVRHDGAVLVDEDSMSA